MNRKNKLVDLAIGGCDFSGTTTQINFINNFLESVGYKVRDIRGTEIDALFHAELFHKINQNHRNFGDFCEDNAISKNKKSNFVYNSNEFLNERKVASFVKNDISTYIDPNSADVWVMEEPTERGAGQVNRVIEQNRSKWKSNFDPFSAALTHQVYRIDEFLRFRQPLRELSKIILRSRSEESACYQIYDPDFLPKGMSERKYLDLPGHQIAFKHPPTHLFIVNGPEKWNKKDYLKLKGERNANRVEDDHEKDVNYQLLVNRRYATSWLEDLYSRGCGMYGGKVPEIIRFDIYNSKEEMKEEMISKLKDILEV